MDVAVKGVAAWLQTQGAVVKPAWLEASVRSVLAPTGVSAATARQPVYDRLLKADFNAVSTGRLPTNVGTMHKAQIAGPVMVQVEQARDIGSALLAQLEQVEGSVADADAAAAAATADDDDGDMDLFAAAAKGSAAGGGGAGKGKKKATWGVASRMVRLEVTDGTTRAVAIEYKTIDAFKDITAGSKLIIKQVDVLRGKLLLRPECVTIAGGSVEGYEDRNDLAKSLRKALKLDEHVPPPKPLSSSTKPEPAPAEVVATVARQQQQQRATTAAAVPMNNDAYEDDDDDTQYLDDDLIAEMFNGDDLDDDFAEVPSAASSRPQQARQQYPQQNQRQFSSSSSSASHAAAALTRVILPPPQPAPVHEEMDFDDVGPDDNNDDMIDLPLDVLEDVERTALANDAKRPRLSNEPPAAATASATATTALRYVARLADLVLPGHERVNMSIAVESLLGKLEYEQGILELHVAVTDDGMKRAEFIFSDEFLVRLLGLTAAEFKGLSKGERTSIRDRLLKPVLKSTPQRMTIDLSCQNRRQLPAIVDML